MLISFSKRVKALEVAKMLKSFQATPSLVSAPQQYFTIKKKSSKIWMNEHVNDIYVKKAKIYNYRSRASFKLIEINHRYNILKPGYKVIDLGAAPGGWSQVAAAQVKSPIDKPSILAIDLNQMENKLPGVHFIKGDIQDEALRIKIKEYFNYGNVDVVMSDMAPNFEGERDIDHANITELNDITMTLCKHILKKGGTLLMKTLNGALEKQYFAIERLFVCSNFTGTGFQLSEDYQKLLKLHYNPKSRKLPVYDSDYPTGLSKEMLRNHIISIANYLEEVTGEDVGDEFRKLIDDTFGGKYEPDLQNRGRLKDAELDEIVTDFIDNKMKGVNFSFNRKIPENYADLIKMMGDPKKKIKEILSGKNTDTNLFDPEPPIEEGEFEKMDSLADIEEMPYGSFEDEAHQIHVWEMEKEKTRAKMLKDFQDKIKESEDSLKGSGFEMEDIMREIKNNPEKFEAESKRFMDEFKSVQDMLYGDEDDDVKTPEEGKAPKKGSRARASKKKRTSDEVWQQNKK